MISYGSRECSMGALEFDCISHWGRQLMGNGARFAIMKFGRVLDVWAFFS
jgi:hypothetical protein